MNTPETIFRGRPAQPQFAGEREGELRVNVVFTGFEQTRGALDAAAALAVGLGARIIVVVPQVIPYPAPLDSAAASRAFLVHRLVAVAREVGVETHISVYVCRERRTALAMALPPRSIVVIGGRRHWWPTREQRLAAELRRQGHQVVLAGAK